MKPVPLGPWPLGIDNVHAPSHRVFQPPGQGQPPARLREAKDVDFDDEGWVSARSGTAIIQSLSDGKRLFGPIVQAGDSLFLSGANIVSSLAGTAEIIEHADCFYWSDGHKCGRIQNGTAKNWGCAVCPTPIGPAGAKQVVAAFVDAHGLEHGASDTALLDGTSINIPLIDPEAVAIRFYVSGDNDDLAFWFADVAIDELPISIRSPTTNDTQGWTQGFGPPLAANVIISHGDSLVLAVGNCLYSSLGAATHLFDYTLETALPETILGGVGLPGGFWVVTSKDAYWISGDTPHQWTITPMRLRCAFARGGQRMSSEMIPGLGLDAPTPVAVFVSQYGPMFALPGGTVMMKFKNRYHVDVNNKRMAVALSDKSKKLIFTLGDV